MTIVLVDDLRDFTDGRVATVARTSAEGVALLTSLRESRIDELWLDHDLGGDDTIWPVVEVLERAAFEGTPLDVGARSEERRVGKECEVPCRSRWSPYH